MQSTEGADLIPELDAAKLEVIVRKGQDPRTEMFSGFADSFGRRLSTGAPVASVDLKDYLSEGEVTDVFVCGLTGDCCVKSTALDAIKMGFKTFVIEDATKTPPEGPWGWEATKDELEEAGVIIISAKDVPARIEGSTNAHQNGKG